MTYLQLSKRTRHIMQSLIFAIVSILLSVEINQENELLEAYLYM